MVAEKIRIKKYLHEDIAQWCEALEISDRRFVEDAIVFYLRYLKGKHPVTPTIPVINQSFQSAELIEKPTTKITVVDSDNPDDFDGGIDL